MSVEDAIQLALCLRDSDTPEDAFAAFERARRPRVEQIIKAAARINNNKAATGLMRVLRDLMLPVFLKFATNPANARQLYGYRIDWSPGRTALA